MSLKVTIESDGLLKALNHAASPMHKAMRVGLKKAATAIQREARITHTYITRSGNLSRSISTGMDGTLSSTVFLDTGIAKYGPYQHDGTGIYGAKKKLIRPVNKKALKFSNGRFSKFSRGIKPDPFIDRAVETKQNDVLEILTKSIGVGIKKAGL